jgi:outer membrane receptor protein involved in Fe transport
MRNNHNFIVTVFGTLPNALLGALFLTPVFAFAVDAPIKDLGRSEIKADKALDVGAYNTDKVQVLDSAELRRRGTFNMIELLGTIPGMDVDPNRTRNNLKLNGLGGDYVKVMVDGIPVTGDVGGGYPLENLAIGDLESIEILSGASSTLYGSDAMGGVVNFVTRKHTQPTTLGMDLQLRHLHNDSLTQWGGKNRADVNLYHASANLELDVYGGWDYDKGISSTGDMEGEGYTLYSYNKDYRYKLGSRMAVHPFDCWSLTPSVQVVRSGSTSSSGTNLLELETEARSYNLAGQWRSLPRLEFSGYGSVRSLSHDNTSIVQVGFPNTKTSATDFLDKEGELRGRIALPKLGGETAVWMVGANMLSEEVESDNLRAGVQRDQAALFSTATWASATSLQVVVTPSVRATLTDREFAGESWIFDDLSPKLGVRFNHIVFKPLSLALSYGEAFKNPGLKKMYYSFKMGNSMWIEGNEALDPEKSRTVSGTLQWDAQEMLQGSVNLFHTQLRDMVVLAQVSNANGTVKQRGLNGEEGDALNDYKGALLPENTYINADEGKAYGGTASLQARPLRWLQVGASYAHTVSRAQASTGEMRDVAEVCPNMAQGSLTFLPIRKVWWWPEVQVSAQWNDRTIDSWTSDTALYSPAFTRLNVYLGQNLSHGVNLDLGANNLLNHVRDGHLGLSYGRMYYLGIRWNAPKIF